MSIAATMAANENVLAAPRRAFSRPTSVSITSPGLRSATATPSVHGQSRLGHNASRGGTAEMTMFGKRGNDNEAVEE
jgi:hypothetical protein